MDLCADDQAGVNFPNFAMTGGGLPILPLEGGGAGVMAPPDRVARRRRRRHPRNLARRPVPARSVAAPGAGPAPATAWVQPLGDHAGAERHAETGHHAGTGLGRAFDMAVALAAIVLFLPLLLAIALAVRLSGPGPVLFVQRRIGLGGTSFPCLKFRTMVANSQEVLHDLLATSAEARGEWARDQKLRNDPRITRIGAVLRKSSLDELPQLFNILAGHMSIVGPRPIVEAEVVRYGARFSAYCSVRPGLTGLWQVSGRNEVSYEARVRLDAFYALRKSTLYDVAICMRTVPAVLASRGCY
ncbi:hypothetical protein GCM10011614_25100 [Novosphingobium colocasiae]|uniref:Bacterial sugar transferase domain-containing protein n=1 Tax=Novosphingobium colocasiae TaxID=1256513 RepID=A0A918PH47_9SPHN|nr:hypothetical protein GCM10011614_25100 [Novosphingobium colocasiae]